MMYTLITGGSSGIGRATAILLAQEGHNLILVSNEESSLLQTQALIQSKYKSCSVKIFYVDLTAPSACNNILSFTQKEKLDVNILINNAGFGTYGYYNEVDTAKEVKMIELNVLAVYKLTRLFLNEMAKKNEGRIINIASIAAFQPGPKLAVYSATKSFVLNYSRALNYELKLQKSNVRVTTICPTPVKTNFGATAQMESSSLFDSWMTVTANDVAQTIIKSLSSSKDALIPKKRFHYLNKFSRRLPSSWLLKFSADQAK